ncbi:MAG: response regulator [Deltaproteobacteria bacterium]|nr:response regulator [Deltaproteobacteria bacterium]
MGRATNRILILQGAPAEVAAAEQEVRRALGPCPVQPATTRDEYVAALEQFQPALIVSELGLPGLDGHGPLRLAQERCPGVPFIVLTASANEDAAVECMEAGASDYVLREHPRRLGPAIRVALGRQRARTERVRTKRVLEQSETRYRRLFEAAQDGILILDASTGTIVDVNPYLMALTGCPRESFIGKYLWEIGPFRDVAASKASFRDLKAMRYIRYDDLPLEACDGRKVDVEFVSNVYRVEGRDEIQCNIRDISERKRAESELLFRNLILSTQQEASLDGILVLDVEGEIVSSNRRLSEMWLLPAGAVDGASGEGVLRALMEKVVQPGDLLGGTTAPYALHETDHAEITLKDGRTFDRYSAPMTGADGRHHGRVWYFRDLSAAKAAEAERAHLQDQLRTSQKLEAIGSLAGGIAHDFNNLLSVILSYTGFVLERLRTDDPVRGDLLEVKKAAERAAALTRQLLAFGRKQVLQPVPLSLNQVAAGVEKMLRRILGEDIDLVQVLAPDLWPTLADPGQLEQVIMNLVVNARDAMPEGGRLTIETANVELDEEYAARHLAVAPGSYVMLAVTDTGCGMDAATRARLFEPFFTTKERGKGTGLGLSTAYGIVRQSGGNIWVYSEPGQGSTFKVYLPREVAAAAVALPRTPVIARPSTGTETVLVIEDEETLRTVARRALEAAGYTVLVASGGEEAFRIAAQHAGELHLLLTDVVLPVMNGRAVARELSRTRPDMKVLYMSGYTDSALGRHGVITPGTHFLGKPFTAVDLAAKVRMVLDAGNSHPAGAAPAATERR